MPKMSDNPDTGKWMCNNCLALNAIVNTKCWKCGTRKGY